MNAVDALSGYLDRCVRRLRRYQWLCGAVLVVGAALLLTIGIAWTMSRIPASPGSLLAERVLLIAGVVIAGCFSLRQRVSCAGAARRIEARFPAFSQQLITFVDRERRHREDPFLPLLADGALQNAAAFPPEQLVSGRRFATGSIALLTALSGLVFLVLTERNAGVLWARQQPFRVDLKAGRNTVRRGGEWTVTARVSGFAASAATLRIRPAGNREWQSVPMLPAGEDSVFAIQLPAVAQAMDYYAESKGVRSPVSHVNVVDLPTVTGIHVTYSENSSPARTEDGDIFAPAGTIANVEIQTDRPLTAGQLVFERGSAAPLSPTARFRVLREDGYHVSVRYDGENVPISTEHSIEVLGGEAPLPKERSLLKGDRVGPMPSGYEQSVSEYYRRLSEEQSARH